jgi:hypothetical protein
MRTAMGLMAGPERPPVTLAMRGARVSIDGQREEGVDQRDRVGAGLLRDAGHGGDAGDVGRELHHERAGGAVRQRAVRCESEVGVGAEDHAAVAGVGAGGVELVDAMPGRR